MNSEYPHAAALALEEFEAGAIDVHQAEQRLIDIGWDTEAISTFLGERDGEA